ncbi:Guanylate cyclase 2G [Lobulomyces angularis]|nr:Guanylate cyclase 2G [Lobulomyces angularis]
MEAFFSKITSTVSTQLIIAGAMGAGAILVLTIIVSSMIYCIKKNKRNTSIKLQEKHKREELLKDFIIQLDEIKPSEPVLQWVWQQQREHYQKVEPNWNSKNLLDGEAIITKTIENQQKGLLEKSNNNKNNSKTSLNRDELKPKKVETTFSQLRYTFISKKNGARITCLKYKISEGMLETVEVNPDPLSVVVANSTSKLNQVGHFDEEKSIGQKLELRLKDENELKWLLDLKQLKHKNIGEFLSVALRQPLVHICYEFFGNGLIEDLIVKQRNTLSFNTRLLMAKNLLDGLSFIHESFIQSHGSLNLRNCFLDETFNLKITGFGVSQFVNDICPPEEEKNPVPIEKLFVAPELVSKYPNLGAGTQQGDVYSAAMMIYTILYQKIPFEKTKDLKEKVGRIVNDTETAVRPNLTNQIPAEYNELISLSWKFNCEERFSLPKLMLEFDQLANKSVKNYLQEAVPPTNTLILSNLDRYMHDLESSLFITQENCQKIIYQKSIEVDSLEKGKKSLEFNLDKELKIKKTLNLKLEKLAQESDKIEKTSISNIKAREEEIRNLKRELNTQEMETLNLEKDCTEIKNFFLPKPLGEIAQSQIQSPRKKDSPQRVNLEYNHSSSYEGVTIMVVTIVHFNRLVEQLSNSHLMLDLLRIYHDSIDMLLQSYPKIYWIDRISDTCIFVSGAPDENYRHAEDMADFALKLENWSRQTDLEWILGQGGRLFLRLGMHSGPITAGNPYTYLQLLNFM